MNEIWKPIPICPGYEVSNIGRIRTRKPINRNSVTNEYRILNPFRTKNGYKRFQCWNNGECKQVLVHRAVAYAFLGPPKDGEVVCHNNGIRDDNRYENLRWGTVSDNSMDCFKHGNHVFLREGHQSKAALAKRKRP